MARGIEGNEISTPKPASLKKTSSSQSKTSKTQNQRSILGFFSKKSENGDAASTPSGIAKAGASRAMGTAKSNLTTPAPSSDAVSSPPLSAFGSSTVRGGRNKENEGFVVVGSSPSRKAKKPISYAESEDEDEDVLKSLSVNAANGPARKKMRVSVEEDSDDEFGMDAEMEEAMMEEADMDDFIAPDDSEDEVQVPMKRKRQQAATKKNTKTATNSSPPPAVEESDDDEIHTPTASTAQQWTYDPDNVHPIAILSNPQASTKKQVDRKIREKVHKTEPEARYTWLANVQDADRNPIGHPDYDPRTIYIPPFAWNKFSPFEKQYWEIKQKFMDTVVFFKKGKFYELYENDATIGHQLFDLKLTDRVNMRMVGVPESSLDMWANQFVAKGFKIARVDQMESALAKEMRERDDEKPVKKTKDDKVIRRELASVLTAGTLVDGGMLQDDMSAFCVALKEFDRDNLPAFGIAFVDTATAQFQITEFTDDVDMTRFETLVAQIRPRELLVEKSCLSTKAKRILQNNTNPNTIWNHLKPGKEFWEADTTCREIDASAYFESKDEARTNIWPTVLEDAREKDLVMSAFGALLQYLRTLKIEREIVSLGNISWYDPIKKATSLVLDGQSLINLEIFANTFDGTTDGTLFSMLNRCITPFGKRMLRQWVCHPLVHARKINERLDAVDALLADQTVTDRFTSSLSKIPDLERLISRVHAGTCKVQEFVRVLDGFEQIEYTMSMLREFGEGGGLLGKLLSSMPDLSKHLKYWKDAFDKQKAKENAVLVPKPGVEEDFDESQETIDDILSQLSRYLKKIQKEQGSAKICYRDNGKEIYQLEIPAAIKSVPKQWQQMSATKAVKRYYTPELKTMVRNLQEAQETHGQIAKEVTGRFYARFDKNYNTWLEAVQIIAHLDCLISLAQASASLGAPSCRPKFVDSPRTIVDFEDLRHPCMLNTVPDFIPNDIKLGGDSPNIDLLTGANAAGKSTILRMTCVAIIIAQLGCHLPCASATLTPIDRIMSRLGANDNIFGGQSTFFVELAETKKILSEATPRSLVILDELGRGTSSFDGVSVAQAVLHHIATHVGCVGFFATHYHSLAAEFSKHPEIRPMRMAIAVDDVERRVTFLYRLEDGVAEGSFGMHCAAMCGIPKKIIEDAEAAAREWEERLQMKHTAEGNVAAEVGLGWCSDLAELLRGDCEGFDARGLEVLRRAVEAM
ncbi:DNA mismatch repair protein Msh6 [Aulographum hederae CBS 113979]|uniref:DNA mismatch repair protein n=1 Tax=Aulographum hederae CBS 113979 TaxID=1176131 RepID=A0A6G1GNQ3_9PEZI|nr:DNA mismatch repair protein Msh6 [Aulographum hederae CBS 113979]